VWGYISAQKLESERSKSFALFISLQTRPSGGSLESLGDFEQVYLHFTELGGYFPDKNKSSQSWSKSGCSQGRLGYSFSVKMKWGQILA